MAKSISIEAAELLECFQWSDEYDRDAVISELADVVNYAILLADKLGVDLEGIVLEKLEQNEPKYPIKKSEGRSTKFNKL